MSICWEHLELVFMSCLGPFYFPFPPSTLPPPLHPLPICRGAIYFGSSKGDSEVFASNLSLLVRCARAVLVGERGKNI